jgi:hypothetical protein
MMAWRLYDFKAKRDGNPARSAIQEWLDSARITKRSRGQLNQKLDMLEKCGTDLPPKLLAGPLASKRQKLRQKHIYKIIVHGDIMLRPFLCKGPIRNDEEFTLLMGVIERNGKNDHDPCEAEELRETIIKDQMWRMRHERYY